MILWSLALSPADFCSAAFSCRYYGLIDLLSALGILVCDLFLFFSPSDEGGLCIATVSRRLYNIWGWASKSIHHFSIRTVYQDPLGAGRSLQDIIYPHLYYHRSTESFHQLPCCTSAAYGFDYEISSLLRTNGRVNELAQNHRSSHTSARYLWTSESPSKRRQAAPNKIEMGFWVSDFLTFPLLSLDVLFLDFLTISPFPWKCLV